MTTTNAPKAPFQPPAMPTRAAKRSPVLGWLILLLVIAGLGYAGWQYRVGLLSGSEARSSQQYQLHQVRRGPLRITVTEDGNVESAQNVDIKCQVEGGSTILWIREEGATVKKGDKLVELDSAALREEQNQQKINCEKARSTLIQAQKDAEVAEIAIHEYLDGTFQQELQTADANIVIAKENLKNSQNMLEHSEKMARKGYINQLQLETNRFSVERAELDLAAAETARRVLVDFTKKKTSTELQSVHEAAKARAASEQAAYELETSKLKRIQDQIDRCILTAPLSGMVIYANEQSRRGSSILIEEGAMVRESQSIIRLPDLTQMQVKVLVHETKVDKISAGMRASIRIRDRTMGGEVIAVASQPEPGTWFQNNVKEYATTVRIDKTTTGNGLKPGMTAEVEIVIDELDDALTVPVLGVMEIDGKFYAWVRGASGPEKRPVVLGPSNDKFIAVVDGLNEGDEVILNPRSTIPEARAAADRETLRRDSNNGGRASAKAGKADAKPKEPPAGKTGKETDKKASSRKSGGGNLMQYDKDKDGKVSKAEAPERMSRFFGMIDANKDGFIDQAEAKAAEQRRQQSSKRQDGSGGSPKDRGAQAKRPGAPGGRPEGDAPSRR